MEKEILTKRERVDNIIYGILKYTLYLIAFGFIAYFSKVISGIALVIFWFFSESHKSNKEKNKM